MSLTCWEEYRYLDEAGGGDHLVPVHHIHNGFADGNPPNGGHVESVHIVPPVDLVVLVLTVLDSRHVQGGPVQR